MTTLRRVVILVAGNLLVTLVLLLAVNLASLTVLSLYRGVHAIQDRTAPARRSADPRYRMPSYSDTLQAAVFWREFGDMRDRYEPFLGWRRLPYQGEAITIGDDGNRVHPPPQLLAKEAPLVRFFGGSTMWGTGAADNGTIPALFNALHPNVHVINHGEHGFTSRQNLDQLITLIGRDDPLEYVVFYDGVNDVAAQCHRAIPVPGHFQVVQIQSALTLRRAALEPLRESFASRLSSDLHDLLLKHTTTLGAAAIERLGLRRRPETPAGILPAGRWPSGEYVCGDDSTKARAVARALLANWRLAYEIVTARGGVFVALLQPVAYVGAPRDEHLAEEWLNPELRHSFTAVYALIREEIATGNHEWMHDLTEAFDGPALLYVDDFHVTERGNAIIAEKVSDLLGGRLPQPPARGQGRRQELAP